MSDYRKLKSWNRSKLHGCKNTDEGPHGFLADQFSFRKFSALQWVSLKWQMAEKLKRIALNVLYVSTSFTFELACWKVTLNCKELQIAFDVYTNLENQTGSSKRGAWTYVLEWTRPIVSPYGQNDCRILYEQSPDCMPCTGLDYYQINIARKYVQFDALHFG